MNQDIYVRAHSVQLEKHRRSSTTQNPDSKWPDYVLAFDCETRLTADQSLTFGFWRFGELQNGIYVPTQEGIVHADEELSEEEFNSLRKYAKATKPETAEDGSDRMHLYSRMKFIQEVFGMAIQAKALIVGFNLPFDLSRLAVDWETAKNGGWSLIFSQWKNLHNELQENKFFPRIVVKALNSKTAIIQSMKPGKPKTKKKVKHVTSYPPARFLDLRTLLWALRNKSYSLRTACKEFGIPGKLDHTPSGTVNSEEIEYCRQDVRATIGLLNAAKQECDLHPIDLNPDKMFSPASVAKSYLEKLNISYPVQKC